MQAQFRAYAPPTRLAGGAHLLLRRSTLAAPSRAVQQHEGAVRAVSVDLEGGPLPLNTCVAEWPRGYGDCIVSVDGRVVRTAWIMGKGHASKHDGHGIAWHGIRWYDMAWHDLGMAWHGMTRAMQGMTWAWHGMA